MKKIAAVICIIMLLLSSCCVFASSNNSDLAELKALGIVSANITEENENTPAAWEEVFFAVRNIAGNDIANSVEELFDTQKPVRYADLCRIAVKILRYEQFAIVQGGTDTAYTEVAELCGITKGALGAPDAVLTKGQMVKIFHNIVFDEFNEVVYSLRDGGLFAVMENSSRESMLADKFGISIYTGKVADINLKKQTIVLSSMKNKYKNNPISITDGQNAAYEVSENINPYEFDHMRVAVWVNENNVITNIFPIKGVSSKYGYISSVNGDMKETSSYSVNHMKRLTFTDEEEEYDVSENAQMKYDGVYTASPKNITGKFVKIVMYNDEVEYIECWNLTEGGLITAVEGNTFFYNEGIYSKKFEELSRFNQSVYFIGGRIADRSEIKTGSVFSYFIDDDFILMVISEKKLYETFKTINVSGNKIQLGSNVYFKQKDTYFSKDGSIYRKNMYDDILGDLVTAYFAPNGRIAYVSADKDKFTEFYGIVTGAETDDLDEHGKIRLIVLEKEPKEKVFKYTKNTDFSDIKIDELKVSAKDLSGSGIYYFRTLKESEDVLQSVSRPKWFEGYGEQAIAEITTFDSYSGSIARATVNDKRIYFTGSKLVAIYEDEGEFKVKYMTWMELHGRQTDGAKIAFYSQGKTEYPEIALITGELSKVGSYYSKYGIVTAKENIINEKGEQCVSLTIVSDAVKNYSISKAEAEKIPLYSLITYYDEIKFSESQIRLKNVEASLTDDYSTWGAPFESGVIDTVAGSRVYFNNGEALYFNQSGYFIVALDADTQNDRLRFKPATAADMQNGDTVYYYAQSGQIDIAVVIS